MSGKITWNQIFKDFKRRHPNLAKSAVNYRPSGFLKILVYFTDGSKVSYDFENAVGHFVM